MSAPLNTQWLWKTRLSVELMKRLRSTQEVFSRGSEKMPLIVEGDGNTPLTEEEVADLIPNLATKQDLNEWERENILRARTWADGDRTTLFDIVTDKFVCRLHSKMFDDTWKWAGEYRKTEKNLGVPV